MTQLWGVLALRLANAELLPFDFESYGENIRQFVADLNLANRVAGHIDLSGCSGGSRIFRKRVGS